MGRSSKCRGFHNLACKKQSKSALFCFNTNERTGFGQLKQLSLILSPGSVLWFIGWLVNVHSDHILRNLRQPGESGYKIPTGKNPKWKKYFFYTTAIVSLVYNIFTELIPWTLYCKKEKKTLITSLYFTVYYMIYIVMFVGCRDFYHYRERTGSINHITARTFLRFLCGAVQHDNFPVRSPDYAGSHCKQNHRLLTVE